MFGLRTWGSGKCKLVHAKKPTKFLANSRVLGKELQKKCDGTHEHQQLVDGRASAAARYPNALCRAICRGIVKAKMERDRGIRVVGEIPAGSPSTRACTVGRRVDPEEFHDKSEVLAYAPLYRLTRVTNNKSVSESIAWDDLTGMRLSADKVIEARGKEMQYVRDMKVWEKIPRRVAQARGWKVIKTRWIDINKGDDLNPVYRSRLVGK